MFERFTRDARAVVVATQDLCRALGTDEVRPVHLLLTLTEQPSAARDVLAQHGVTTDAVSEALGAPRPSPPAPLGVDDAAALRSLGIDLDAIREAVDRQFGEGALDGALAPDNGDLTADSDSDSDSDSASPEGDAGTAADPGRRWFGLGPHVRFGRGSKKVLELAVREAIHQRSGDIGAEHIALGLLRTDDDAVRLLLRTLATDPRALRADLQGRGLRSA
jgi:hypothetical protein